MFFPVNIPEKEHILAVGMPKNHSCEKYYPCLTVADGLVGRVL